MAAAAAACIGRRSRRKGTPHASLLNSNSERKREREGEREGAATKIGEKRKESGRMEERKKGEKGSPGKNLPRTMLL